MAGGGGGRQAWRGLYLEVALTPARWLMGQDWSSADAIYGA